MMKSAPGSEGLRAENNEAILAGMAKLKKAPGITIDADGSDEISDRFKITINPQILPQNGNVSAVTALMHNEVRTALKE